MNKKYIEQIIGMLTIISYGISIYKESKIWAISTTILVFLALLIYFVLSWNKEKTTRKIFEKKSKVLEKDLQKKEDENKKLRKETCKNCKRVNLCDMDNSISFGENFNSWVLPYEGNSEDIVDTKDIYYLDNYLFINFHDEDSEGKCYLINFVDGVIYLPIDDNEWKGVLGDRVFSYRLLCSKRINHLSFDQLL